MRFRWEGLKTVGACALLAIGCIIALMFNVPTVKSQVQSSAGLAVAQTSTKWVGVRDATVALDSPADGVMSSGLYVYDGSNFKLLRGDATNGLWVQVKSTTGQMSGTEFYAIKKADLTTGSENIAFGFTSKKVILETPSTNTDDVCIDWIGGTAACPSANTAGNDVINPGRIIILDDYAVASISAIAASGTQTIYVRAFN